MPTLPETSIGGDELSIATMASVPMLYNIITMTSADVADDVLLTIPVNPKYNPQFSTFNGVSMFLPTHCNKATIPFDYWRGTMRYKFYVVASSFHSCRLRICFNPMHTASSNAHENMSQRIIDIQGSTNFTVSVPFLWPQLWARHSIGSLSIQVESQMSVIGDNTNIPITILVYSAAASDLMVRCPNNHYCISSSALGAPVVLESNPRAEFLMPFDSINPNASSITFVDPCFPDAITHFSTLLHTPQPWIPTQVVSSLPINSTIKMCVSYTLRQQFNPIDSAESVFSIQNIDNAYNVPYMTATAGHHSLDYTVTTGDVPAYYNKVSPSILDHLGSSFKFQRGGMRLKFQTRRPNYAASYFDVRIAREKGSIYSGIFTAPIADYTVPDYPIGVIPYATYHPDFEDGITQFSSLHLNDVMQVEIPYSCNALYRPVGLRTLAVGNSIFAPTPPTTDNISESAIYAYSPNWSECRAIFRCAADDFKFHYLKDPGFCVLATNLTLSTSTYRSIQGTVFL